MTTGSFTLYRTRRRDLAFWPRRGALLTVMIAAGICAGAASINLLQSALWRALPLPSPQRLVRIAPVSKTGGYQSLSAPIAYGLSRALTSLSATCTYSDDLLLSSSVGGRHLMLTGMVASGGCFNTLGVRPFRGRLLAPNDEASAAQVAVLAYTFWRAHFPPARPLEKDSLAIAGKPFRVIGVLPPTFSGLDPAFPQDLVVPLSTVPAILPGLNGANFLTTVGRLQPRANPREVQSEATAVWPRLARTSQDRIAVTSAASGAGFWRQRLRPTLITACVLAALLLLILLVSVAAASAADHRRRRTNLATRAALGAGRARLTLGEGLRAAAPCAPGLLLGLALVPKATSFLQSRLWQGSAPLQLNLYPTTAVIGATIALALASALAAGAGPALATWHLVGRPWHEARRAKRVSRRAQALVTVQTALALAMLVNFGLLLASLDKLTRSPLGFDPHNVITVDLYPVPDGYRRNGLRAYHRQLLTSIERVPGVLSAAYSKLGPVSPTGFTDSREVNIPGRGTVARADLHMVSANFFRTLRIPFMSGVNLSDTRSAPAAVVNESLARRIDDPIGQEIQIGDGHSRFHIVGVVADARLYDPHRSHAPAIFLPILSRPGSAQNATLVIRTQRNSPLTNMRIQTAIEAMGREFPVRTKSLAEAERRATATLRSAAEIGAFLAIDALLLALMSTHATARSLADSQRCEWAIRAALGASPAHVFRHALASTLPTVAAGVAVGIPLAYASSVAIHPLLFKTNPFGIATVAGSVAAIALAATTAVVGPALSASRARPWPSLTEDALG